MRNLVQDNKVTGYYPCSKKSALAKYTNMEEEATTGVDSQQATENQAMLEVELPAKCHHSNKMVKRTQFLISLMFHK